MKSNSIATKGIDNCCGCGNCDLSCPKDAIKMQNNGEGFAYPIVDDDLCINCGKCLKVCPFEVTIKNYRVPVLKSYSGYYGDKNEHLSTSSGGAATAISRSFVNSGGIVYGASYSSDYKTIKIERITTPEGLNKLKGSKYAQTIKGDIFNSIKTDLKNGSKVLFIGLPCDVAALKKYIKDEKELYTAELICSGVTSQKAHGQFIDYIEHKSGNILTNFTYRNKDKGMMWPFIKAYSGSSLCFNKPWYASLAGYNYKTLMRYSCYNCKFKGIYNLADLTLGDFWGIKKSDIRYNANGVSAIVVHSEKGVNLMNSIESFILQDASFEEILNGNPRLTTCLPKPYNRELFGKLFVEKGLVEACNECRTLKDRVKDIIKEVIAFVNI